MWKPLKTTARICGSTFDHQAIYTSRFITSNPTPSNSIHDCSILILIFAFIQCQLTFSLFDNATTKTAPGHLAPESCALLPLTATLVLHLPLQIRTDALGPRLRDFGVCVAAPGRLDLRRRITFSRLAPVKASFG